MTKNEHEIIASALKASIPDNPAICNRASILQWEITVVTVTNTLITTEEKFNPPLFLKRAGYYSYGRCETCGRFDANHWLDKKHKLSQEEAQHLIKIQASELEMIQTV